jgi:hypothetical protein
MTDNIGPTPSSVTVMSCMHIKSTSCFMNRVRGLVDWNQGTCSNEIMTMSMKPQPNHQVRLSVLRRMSAEIRLLKALELSDFTRKLFIHGLRRRFPDISEEAFHKILLERLDKCHNRNY